MREIKFRAWDKTNNKMIHWKGMQLWLMSSLENDNIMQYTGIKDKNGKEIYEGDIVKVSKDAFAVRHGQHKGIDVVKLDLRTWLKNESFGYEGEDLINPFNCEVIGNKWQHPNLLEVK